MADVANLGQILATAPSQPDSTQLVSLGGTQYQMRLYYRERLAAWYLDWSKADGTPLFTGRRVTPGYGANIGILPTSGDPDDVPNGKLYVFGPSEYEMMDLGSGPNDKVLLVYYPDDELPTATPDPAVFVVL